MSSIKQYDIRQISEMLAARAESVCEWLLPGGKREGREWRAGSITGETGKSLGVNLSGKPGVWRDFADDAKGGDLIDLIQAVHGITKADAVREAKEFLGIAPERPQFAPERKKYVKPTRPSGLTKPSPEMLLWFEKRGISKETVEAFRVGQLNHREKGPVIVFPYIRGEERVFIKLGPLHDKKGM